MLKIETLISICHIQSLFVAITTFNNGSLAYVQNTANTFIPLARLSYFIEIVNEHLCPYIVLQQHFSLLQRDKLSPHHEGALGEPEQPPSLFMAGDHQFMVEVKFHPLGW